MKRKDKGEEAQMSIDTLAENQRETTQAKAIAKTLGISRQG